MDTGLISGRQNPDEPRRANGTILNVESLECNKVQHDDGCVLYRTHKHSPGGADLSSVGCDSRK